MGTPPKWKLHAVGSHGKKKTPTLPPPASEAEEQRMLAKWLNLSRVLWCHCPNGEHRDVRVGARLKALGVKPGVPDILVFTPPPKSPQTRGVAIELKRVGTSRVSPYQQEWLDDLQMLGWDARVCCGAGDAIHWLSELGYGV